MRGSKLVRIVLREAVVGVRSVAEAKARDAIRRARLPEPLWNHDIYTPDGRWLARPDATWKELGVVLEIDSMEWHLSPAAYRKTQARQRRLAKHGLIVIPIAPSDFDHRPEAVLAEIRATLEMAKGRLLPRSPFARPPAGQAAA